MFRSPVGLATKTRKSTQVATWLTMVKNILMRSLVLGARSARGGKSLPRMQMIADRNGGRCESAPLVFLFLFCASVLPCPPHHRVSLARCPCPRTRATFSAQFAPSHRDPHCLLALHTAPCPLPLAPCPTHRPQCGTENGGCKAEEAWIGVRFDKVSARGAVGPAHAGDSCVFSPANSRPARGFV